MKKIILISLAIILFNGKAFSVPLSKALLQAYNENPVLNAERENIQVSREDVKISRSEFLPSVTLSGSKSQENTEKLTDGTGANSSFTDVDPKTQSINIEQKLFQGFAGIASMEIIKFGLVVFEISIASFKSFGNSNIKSEFLLKVLVLTTGPIIFSYVSLAVTVSFFACKNCACAPAKEDSDCAKSDMVI